MSSRLLTCRGWVFLSLSRLSKFRTTLKPLDLECTSTLSLSSRKGTTFVRDGRLPPYIYRGRDTWAVCLVALDCLECEFEWALRVALDCLEFEACHPSEFLCCLVFDCARTLWSFPANCERASVRTEARESFDKRRIRSVGASGILSIR
jgi:hypothetical protein